MEWISVKEKKPKINQSVLCAHAKDKWVVSGYMAKGGLWYNQFQDHFNDVPITVTHWAKKPSPPKS